MASRLMISDTSRSAVRLSTYMTLWQTLASLIITGTALRFSSKRICSVKWGHVTASDSCGFASAEMFPPLTTRDMIGVMIIINTVVRQHESLNDDSDAPIIGASHARSASDSSRIAVEILRRPVMMGSFNTSSPTAGTCFNTFKLPPYETEAELRRRVRIALNADSGMGL